MMPIHQLLSRIQWDPEFGKGEFAIGYYDRVDDRIVTVPLRQVSIDPGDHFACRVTDSDGETHMLPFHRIRQVFRNGELIWHRKC